MFDIEKKYLALVSAILVLGVFGAFTFSGLEVADTKDELTFTMYSEDMSEGRFDPGTPTNYASIDSLEIETGNLGMEGFYFYACYEDVEITEDGQTLFDETVQDALYNNEGIEDENLDDFTTPNGYEIDIQRVRSSTTTEEFWDGWDTVVDDCYGSTIEVSKPVDVGAIDVELEIDEERDLEDRVVGELHVDNQWEDIELDLDAELCVAGDFCEDAAAEDMFVASGDERTFTVIDIEGIGADVSVDVDGEINYMIDEDIEGFMYGSEQVSNTDSVKVASFGNDRVSEFERLDTEKEIVVEEPEDFEQDINTIQNLKNRVGNILSILPLIGNESGGEQE